MKNILLPRHRPVLKTLCKKKVLFAFDFDGTIAPLEADRNKARLKASTHALLARLATEAPCALVSGRGLRDVAGRCRGIRWAGIVGNHGAERHPAKPQSARLLRQVMRWSGLLLPLFQRVPGLDIEEKRYSLSVHYRGVRNERKALWVIEEGLKKLGPHRVIKGKKVINIVPLGLPHKGDAILDLKRSLRCEHVLYVGDDITDEDVFDLPLEPPALVSVRIGNSRESSARFYIARQPQINQLLTLIRVILQQTIVEKA